MDGFDFDAWLAYGVEHGYCSDWVCETHDGMPLTPAEEKEWDNGSDPCIVAVRIFADGKPLDLKDTRYRS